MEDDKVTTKVLDPTEYDGVVTTKYSTMIDTFWSRIMHAQTGDHFHRCEVECDDSCSNVLRRGCCPKV